MAATKDLQWVGGGRGGGGGGEGGKGQLELSQSFNPFTPMLSKCASDVVRIGSIIIFHLSKL